MYTSLSLSLHIYIYIHMCDVYIHIIIYIYIYTHMFDYCTPRGLGAAKGVALRDRCRRRV